MENRWRVLLPEEIHPAGPESISDFADCVGMDTYDDRATALDDIGDYDAVIVRVAEIDSEVVSRADRLKVIAKHGAGVDNIDVKAASGRGIVVCNTPGANARSVAEHTVTLLLALRRNLRTADIHVRQGGWDRSTYAGREIQGDTLGLFGYGAIAREVADIALGMGQAVLTYDPYITDQTTPDGVERVETSLELFERANAVSIHVPLTDETRHAVGGRELRALGPSGVLVNTSRGGVVDEDALVDTLANGHLDGAGLDVFETEPPSAGHPLLDIDRVVLTPHIGGVTGASMEQMSLRAAAGVRAVHDGELPASPVNTSTLV